MAYMTVLGGILTILVTTTAINPLVVYPNTVVSSSKGLPEYNESYIHLIAHIKVL